ncbi:MAG: acid phosphatase [Candidatus Rokuibacteriota bacterium]|nr:MAG: acid phosphatase [Candidatus Rokubacteria bacterium]
MSQRRGERAPLLPDPPHRPPVAAIPSRALSRAHVWGAGLLAAALVACAAAVTGAAAPRGADAPIDHIIVLLLENRSFDHLFGTYPGATGLGEYSGKQADPGGVTYPTLPQPIGRGTEPDPRFPADLPNAPFAMLRFVGPYDQTGIPVHTFYHMQRQYGAGADGTPMGKWVAEGTSGGASMGYFDRAASPVQWRLADEFVLLDHYFQGIHGGSFANHFYLISATLARYREAPERYRAQLAADGSVVRDGEVDPDGYVVNNLDPPYAPQRVPEILTTPQTVPTIADRLDAAGVTWRWYAAGWGAGADAVSNGLVPHHNPFQYVKRIMETPEGRGHIRDASEFVVALRAGGLPSVAFVKPHWKDNAHPWWSTVGAGDRWIGEMVRAIMASRYWPRVAVVITYDEGGGWFDHVPPPVVDRFGLGTRVPALVVSPYARRGLIARGRYDHASILKLIEWRFGLEPLTERDRRAAAFLEAFDFSRPPRPPAARP